MNLDLLLSDSSYDLRSCRIKIVSDNAISPLHSWSKLVQPPIQLAPFGSSWMKIGPCPERVKDRMKLQVSGTRLTMHDKRWRACIHPRNPSTLNSRQDEHDRDRGGGLLRKCQSESNLSSHWSTPKMPVRIVSPKKKDTAAMKCESIRKTTCDVIMLTPTKQCSYLPGRRHPSVMIAEGLDKGLPSVSPNLKIEAISCDNLALPSSTLLGLRLPKCTDTVDSSLISQQMATARNCTATTINISSFEISMDKITPVYFGTSKLFGQQNHCDTVCTSKGKVIASEKCSPEDDEKFQIRTNSNMPLIEIFPFGS